MRAAEIEHWLALDSYKFWVAEADGELSAYADVGERAERTRYWLDLRPLDHDSAVALLETAEAWARRRAAPGALLRGVAAAPDRQLRTLYESTGFRIVRYSFEMGIRLDGELPGPAWPAGIGLEAFESGRDDRPLWEADQEAFADHWEFTPDPFGQWRHEVLGHPDFDPSLCFLAGDGDAIVGLAVCFVRDLGEPVGWIQVLGVRPAWRRRGIGLALLHHAFREFRMRGLERAGLDVDAENLSGAVRLYERAGMHVVKEAVTYEKELSQSA